MITKADVVNFRSGYMDNVFNPREIRKRAKKALSGIQFDTVIGTGMSGVLPLQTIAAQFKVYAVAVRKNTEGSHSTSKLEGHLGRRWLFVDDFISSGTTFAKVHKAVRTEAAQRGFRTECVGAFQYEKWLEDCRYQDMEKLVYDWDPIKKEMLLAAKPVDPINLMGWFQ